MDEKSISILEYRKILERLAEYADFSASEGLALALKPVTDLETARLALRLTSEARLLLDLDVDFSVGGARDVRQQADLAAHRGVLEISELLDIKNTLVSARDLVRSFTRLDHPFPVLQELVSQIVVPAGVVDSISRVLSDRGEIMDQASEKLANLRRESKIARERLLSRLERLINDPKTAPMLQEQIITQRNGRFVIPLRSDFKGRVRAIIHDQSASGATIFVEPLAVVEMNNRVHELELAERDEERRILAELSDQVGLVASDIKSLVQVLAEIDLAMMCAKYAEDIHASEPELLQNYPGQDAHPGSIICLRQARHPLLDPSRVVPIDVELDAGVFSVIITGPNTGGKTVTLKTVGLLALMAQSGLHIPAQSGSSLSIFKDIFADIGDEQSIEQSLSTFSGHISNIVRILHQVSRESLVLLDELGAGTDPQEGAALARAILISLIKKPVTNLVATHYPELKSFAHSTAGVVNASMEFDIQSLSPTYHLNIGLPGRSNALLIAERLGLDEDIILDARAELDPADLRSEDLLDEIHHQRDAARLARSAAEESRQEVEKNRNILELRLEKLEDERLDVLEQARSQAGVELESLRAEMDEVRRALGRNHQPLVAFKELQEQVDIIEEQIQKPVRRRKIKEVTQQPIKVGSRVRLRSLNMEGVVISLGAEDAEVQAGALRIRARLQDLQSPAAAKVVEIESKKASSIPPSDKVSMANHPSPGMELNLRGMRAEDALVELEKYLDNAFMAGMPFVRIIHGKGTGRLREVVRQSLRHAAHVSGWQSGQDSEGGDGVTVARIKEE